MAGKGNKEEFDRQNPSTWKTVADGDGVFRGGLFCNQAVSLVIRGADDNTETFDFPAGQFVPMDIKEVVSGATGNRVIGYN